MKFSRIIKTVFMADFAAGLLIALKKYLSLKKLLIILLKKEKSVHDLEESML